jgi:hypothetical protein
VDRAARGDRDNFLLEIRTRVTLKLVTTKPQARSSISRQVCSGELVGLWPAIGSPPRDTEDKEAMKIFFWLRTHSTH